MRRLRNLAAILILLSAASCTYAHDGPKPLDGGCVLVDAARRDMPKPDYQVVCSSPQPTVTVTQTVRVQASHVSRARQPAGRPPGPVRLRRSAPPSRTGGAPVRATWYEGRRGACGPLRGLYAASGRDMLGGHVKCGTRVEVCHSAECVTVTILDRCAGCGAGIDLAAGAFRRLAPLSRGVIRVTIRRAT